MRYKDENKLTSIFDATLHLINEFGLHGTSISKIAKKANVSPATIYVYFDNKEDLINKLYLFVKEDMSQAMFTDIPSNYSIVEKYNKVLIAFAEYVRQNQTYFLFIEQLQNTAGISKDVLEESDEMFEPMYDIFREGIELGVIKEVDLSILKIVSFQPVVGFLKQIILQEEEFDFNLIEEIIFMCWKAIVV